MKSRERHTTALSAYVSYGTHIIILLVPRAINVNYS